MVFPVLVRNVLATTASFIGATVWTKLFSHLVFKRVISPMVARKVIHMTTAPLFTFTWPLYSHHPRSAYFAAMVPCFFAIRILVHPASDSIARAVHRSQQDTLSNSPIPQNTNSTQLESSATLSSPNTASKQQLRWNAIGPIAYGIATTILTGVGWRGNVATYVAMSALCFGDAMADIIGSTLNKWSFPLPRQFFYKTKTVPGTLAFFGSTIVSSMVWLRIPFFTASFVNVTDIPLRSITIVAAAASVTEILPFEDNFTVPIVSFILARALALQS